MDHTNTTNKNDTCDKSGDKSGDKSCDEPCGICGDSYDNNLNISYKLKCNHVFHYNCLVSTFMHSPKYYNQCPSCTVKVGYLDIPNNRTPIKKINGHTIDLNKCKCHAVLISGKRMGLKCNAKVHPSYIHCKRHLKLN